MEEIYHIPAMLKETIEGLAIKPNGVYVDVTFGGGGHSRAILERLTPPLSKGEGGRIPSGTIDETTNRGRLFSFDQDIEAYENAIREKPHPNPPHEGEGSRMTSGIMDDEKNAGLKTREQDEEKAGIIELDIQAQYKKDLARLFQALRIEVNDEMGALREMLVAARDLVKPGGRIAILTYHSLEDRLVKNFFRSGNLEGTIEKDFYGNAITPFDVIEKGRVASEDEVERNPRSRSAKLRVAERKGG